MKKKLLPFILGCSMLAAALPFTAHAEDGPEQDSGNVKYGGFAQVTTQESGDTPVLTAIPECTLTIPRDTTIKRGSLSANIGRVTVDGKYFVKPYYVEVKATNQNFTKVENGSVVANPKANQDILFDVATTTGAPATSGTAAANTTLVQNGTVALEGENSHYTPTYACVRFWKNLGEDAAYKAGEITPINGQKDIFVNIAEAQWTGVSGSEAVTKPQGGQYKGSISFTATFRDDFADTDMAEWDDLA